VSVCVCVCVRERERERERESARYVPVSTKRHSRHFWRVRLYTSMHAITSALACAGWVDFEIPDLVQIVRVGSKLCGVTTRSNRKEGEKRVRET
jgi:hypothetical protein